MALQLAHDTIERARLLARPLTSFVHRDMTLLDAAPSVLVQHDPLRAGTQPPFGQRNCTTSRALSINVPRTVYSTFSDTAGAAADEAGLDTVFYSPRSLPQSPHSQASDQLQEPIPACNGEAGELGKSSSHCAMGSSRSQRVQFRDPHDFGDCELAPTPRCNGGSLHGIPAILTREDLVGKQQGPSTASPTLVHLASDAGFISRRASNMHARAGTLDELLDASSAVQGLDAGHCAGLARRRSSVRGHGASYLSDMFSVGSSAARGAAARMGDLWHELDTQPSRRTSNMSDRAGTFEELMGHGGSHSTAPSAMQTFYPPIKLGLDAAVVSAGPADPALLLSKTLSGDEEVGEGCISRRYTNMSTAAGAFDDLIDEDGDVLPPDDDALDTVGEYNDPFLHVPFQQPLPQFDPRSTGIESTGGRTNETVSLRGLVADRLTVSLSGASDASQRASGNGRLDGLLMSPLVTPFPEAAMRPPGGAAAVSNFLAAQPPGLMGNRGDVLASFATTAGALPSDQEAEVDGADDMFAAPNPVATRIPSTDVGCLPSDMVPDEADFPEGYPTALAKGESPWGDSCRETGANMKLRVATAIDRDAFTFASNVPVAPQAAGVDLGPAPGLRPIRVPRVAEAASNGGLISFEQTLQVTASSQATSRAASIVDSASLPSHLSIKTPHASYGGFVDVSGLPDDPDAATRTLAAGTPKALISHLSMRGPHHAPYHRALQGYGTDDLLQQLTQTAPVLPSASKGALHRRVASELLPAAGSRAMSEAQWQECLARKESLAVISPGEWAQSLQHKHSRPTDTCGRMGTFRIGTAVAEQPSII